MSTRWGPFTVGAPLGSGGLAEVHAAVDERGRQVALKRPFAAGLTPDLRALFALEQAAALRVPPHPALATGVDAGEVDGRPYLALTRAPGAPLRHDGGWSVAHALAIASAACDAAAHLHEHGLVHGDIHPRNLIVEPRAGAVPSVMLVDLGVTRPLGASGPVRGTPSYMAPEQVRGEPWTPATDVFAIGVVLWELLAGARLFLRAQAFLSQAAVVEQPAPPLPPAIDRAIDEVVQRALIKDPAQRLPSPAALREALLA